MTETYGDQLILIDLPPFETEVLKFICQRSNSLYNQAIYFVRRNHEMTHPGLLPNMPYSLLCSELKDQWNYSMLCAQAAQQTLKSVQEAFDSYKGLMAAWKTCGLEVKPRVPKYRQRGGLFPVTYPAAACTFYLDKSEVRIPLGNGVKDDSGLAELFIPCPYGVRREQIKEVQILPRNGTFYAVYVYKSQSFTADVDFNIVLGIDHGLSNWLTCVSTDGKSFIIDGRQVKSLNQHYNKRVATLKEGKAQGFWSDELAAITEKRNRQMRDAINKAARFIINRCLASRIGTVIFGWNQGNKDGIDIGKKNNQEFVQVPTAKLKDRIAQLCKQYGLRFVETEESYTSKASFLDDDFLPTFGEKSERWKPSGKRGQRQKGVRHNLGRGGYQTADGSRINSDCNGAVNIIRKVATQLGIGLSLASLGQFWLCHNGIILILYLDHIVRNTKRHGLSLPRSNFLESSVLQPEEKSTLRCPRTGASLWAPLFCVNWGGNAWRPNP